MNIPKLYGVFSRWIAIAETADEVDTAVNSASALLLDQNKAIREWRMIVNEAEERMLQLQEAGKRNLSPEQNIGELSSYELFQREKYGNIIPEPLCLQDEDSIRQDI